MTAVAELQKPRFTASFPGSLRTVGLGLPEGEWEAAGPADLFRPGPLRIGEKSVTASTPRIGFTGNPEARSRRCSGVGRWSPGPHEL